MERQTWIPDRKTGDWMSKGRLIVFRAFHCGWNLPFLEFGKRWMREFNGGPGESKIESFASMSFRGCYDEALK